MQITHLGHACLLVEVADQRILIDPGNFSEFDEVSDLTAVVVTHQHADHLDPERAGALLEANPGARVLLEAQTAQAVPARGMPIASRSCTPAPPWSSGPARAGCG